jgi:hypothetical protein
MTPEEPHGELKTLRESLINHPDLYDLVKALGQLDAAVDNSAKESMTFISSSIKKSFTFTKGDGGYTLSIETSN